MSDDDLIATMRAGYQRSNLQTLDLKNQADPLKHIAIILAHAPQRHQYSNPIGFDPVHIYFVRKMIRNEILENRIRVIKQDYFKAAIYLDFFMHHIVDSCAVLEEIKKKGTQLEEINPFLDVNLELCIRLCVLDYLSNYREVARRDRRKESYHELNTEINTLYAAFRTLDPLYESVASLIIDQFQQESIKRLMGSAKGISDLAALAFIDMNLSSSKKSVRKAMEPLAPLLESGEYFKAAHFSMEIIAGEKAREPLTNYVKTIQPTTY